MSIENDLTNATFDELWEEMKSRFDRIVLVHERPGRKGGMYLSGVDYRGTKVETLGLLTYGLIRVGQLATVSDVATEEDTP